MFYCLHHLLNCALMAILTLYLHFSHNPETLEEREEGKEKIAGSFGI